ncbi:MAG: hypothetical protein HZA15_08835 [Nitrospirae bacterium]|nr:hypothetical protein [Nitrospirota bacterium]
MKSHTADRGFLLTFIVLLFSVFVIVSSAGRSDAAQLAGSSADRSVGKGGSWAGVYVQEDNAVNYQSLDASGDYLLTPNGGEKLMTGSTYQITWGAPPTAVKFTLQYSINNGAVWKTIATNIAGTSYTWTVPPQTANKPNSLVKVIAYNASGAQVAFDQSNARFLMSVVRLTSPNGGESWNAGTVQPITWTTGTSIKPISQVNLYYKVDSTGYKPITSFVGTNPGTYNWTVPTVTANKTACKLKVEFLYTGITAKGNDINDANFTIKPAGVPVQNATAGESSEYLIQQIGAIATGIRVTEAMMTIADNSFTNENSTADGQVLLWTEPESGAIGIGLRAAKGKPRLSGEYLTAFFGDSIAALNLDRAIQTVSDDLLTITTDTESYKVRAREDGSIITLTGAEDLGIFGIAFRKTSGADMPALQGTYVVHQLGRGLEGGTVKTVELSFDGSGDYQFTEGVVTGTGKFEMTAEGVAYTEQGDQIILSADGEVLMITGLSDGGPVLGIGIKKK